MIAATIFARVRGGLPGRIALSAAVLSLLASWQVEVDAQAPKYTELTQFKDPPEYSKKKTELMCEGTADEAGLELSHRSGILHSATPCREAALHR